MSGIIPPHVLGHLVSAADPSCAVHAANSRENHDSGFVEAGEAGWLHSMREVYSAAAAAAAAPVHAATVA